jgi:ABC-type nickel/cobalt efflux system permease component RcnA
MNFDFLFTPVEQLDDLITGLFDGAPLVVALAIAFLLGLRHASDPDHLVAVTSLVAAEDGDTRQAARLGAWWGVGHATALLALGVPLIVFKAELPSWLESGAEKAIGAVILLLAARVIYKWARGDYRADAHAHEAAPARDDQGAREGREGEGAREGEGTREAGYARDRGHARRRHLRRAAGGSHQHMKVRSRGQATAIGLLHGLAGTGAVVVLLIAALPTKLEAGLALAVFAPMSVASMAACTAAFAWVLTRPVIEPLYRGVLIPGFGAFGVMFGLWYAGLGV